MRIAPGKSIRFTSPSFTWPPGWCVALFLGGMSIRQVALLVSVSEADVEDAIRADLNRRPK